MSQLTAIRRGPEAEPEPGETAGVAGRGVSRDVTWPAVGAIAWREVVRFFRQRNRVVGAVATPVVFWLLLGLGANDVFDLGGRVVPGETAAAGAVGLEGDAAEGGAEGWAEGGVGYLEYFFPGMVVMVVLFTSIFSTITVIDDRNNGFLQGVLASPARRWAIVLGKVLGGAAIGALQGLVLLPLGWWLFGWPGLGAVLWAAGLLGVMAVGLTALGLMFAWPMDSTAGYHAVMNLVQFPMWFLCGAVFPLASAGVLKWVMYANPLTYGYAALSGVLLGERSVGIGLPWWTTVGLTVVLAGVGLALASRVAAGRGGS